MSAPAALRPFVKALSTLDGEIARALSMWLPRLSLLLGPLHRQTRDGGDPDGYSGVARRGPYERLLLSEWATALAVPDEFIRRAAMSEHLFVELTRKEPAGALHSLVVVDSGPDQLGAPRLVHLAAGIVGEARAQAARAAYAWGATSEPVRLFSRVDTESVRAVLSARRNEPLDERALERWAHALSMFGGEVDVVFVGGARLELLLRERLGGGQAPALRGARILRVDAVLDEPALDVHLHPIGRGLAPRRSAPLRLSLPSDQVVVRALRDPFEKDRARTPSPSVAIRVTSGLWVPPGSRRVLVRANEGLVAVVEPNSPRQPLGIPKLLPMTPDEELVAAGMVGKNLIAVVRSEERFKLALNGQRHDLELRGDFKATLDGDRVRPLAVYSAASSASAGGGAMAPRVFLDDDNCAFLVFVQSMNMTGISLTHLVPPMRLKSGVISVTQKDTVATMTASATLELLVNERRSTAHVGWSAVNGETPGVLAIQIDGAQWALITVKTRIDVHAPGVDVLGATMHPAHGPALIARDGDTILAFYGKDGIERHSFASKIVAASPNLDLPQVAVLTNDGSLHILFLKTGARVLAARRA